MSLLDRAKQDIIVFPEEEFEDRDGNIILRPSAAGISAKAELQPARQSGTSARRAEQDNEGYETEEVYRLRFARKVSIELAAVLPLGQASEIEWLGTRWNLVGNVTRYMGSRRTAHHDYQIRRN
jgi:hypothetical protein